MGAFDFVKKVMPKRLKIQDRFHVRKEMISGTMSKFYMVEDKVTGETFGLKVLDK